VFGWAVRVAFVQLSPGLMWTTSILFCMYLLSVIETIWCTVRKTSNYVIRAFSL